MGALPTGVEVIAAETDAPVAAEFWVPAFLKREIGSTLFDGMPELRVIQLLSAGADVWVGRVPPTVTLCDARGVHSASTSEWAVTAMLSYLRDFPYFARQQAKAEWSTRTTGELAGKRVLIVGAGDIGEAIAARLRPFEVSITRVARSARPGVHAVSELPALLPSADVVVLIVPKTSETVGLVDAAFLAAMPDGALLVNAARGPVVDTEALTRELASGRLGAALDVTDPEPLPADHPLWSMPNLLLTPHVAGSVHGLLPRAYRLVGDQVRRYAAGEPLINQVAGEY